MKISLNKYIASCGICSRRKADELIISGRILVNDKSSKDIKYIDNDVDIIKYDGKILKSESKKIYIMLNKPIGVVSTVNDEKGRQSVLDLVDIPERIYPVGRLDYHSSGLIILTNDGELTNKLTHPKYHLDKEYIVSVNSYINDRQLKELSSGIRLDDGEYTMPAKVKRIGDKKFSIVLQQGLNRQIRRMCESIGLSVVTLKRIRIGELVLKDLPVGRFSYFDVKIFTKDKSI